MSELDRWPFIYRHPAPEKLVTRMNVEFGEALRKRGIDEIGFGNNTEIQKDKIPVKVKGEVSEVQTIKNPKIGVVWLKRNADQGTVAIYWNVPVGLEYSEAVSILREIFKEVIDNNDDTRRIQNTFK